MLRRGLLHGHVSRWLRDSCIMTELTTEFTMSVCAGRQAGFSVSNELLSKSQTTPLPSHVSHSELPQHFCDFFSSNIRPLCDDIDSCTCEPPTFAEYDGPMYCHFDSVTEKETCELTVQSPTKSCMLNPIPTSLLKQCLDELVLLVTAIVNTSLSTGTVLKQSKQVSLGNVSVCLQEGS